MRDAPLDTVVVVRHSLCMYSLPHYMWVFRETIAEENCAVSMIFRRNANGSVSFRLNWWRVYLYATTFHHYQQFSPTLWMLGLDAVCSLAQCLTVFCVCEIAGCSNVFLWYPNMYCLSTIRNRSLSPVLFHNVQRERTRATHRRTTYITLCRLRSLSVSLDR